MLDTLHMYSDTLYEKDNIFAGIPSVKETTHLSSLKSKPFMQATLVPISALERIQKRKILLLFIMLLPNL